MNTLNKLFIDISSINIFTLLINIILIVIQSSRINDYIHEIGHCVTIYITKYIIRFNEKIKVTIKYKGDNKKTKILKTYSNFYSFLDKSDKHKYRNIIRETIIKVDFTNNFVVLRTYAGMAQAAAAAIDGMGWSEIVGTIAGDDTIFVLMRDNTAAIEFSEKLKQITRGNV